MSTTAQAITTAAPLRARLFEAERLLPKQRRFVLAFTLLLCVVFSPSKALGQISALLLIAAMIVYVRVSIVNHLIKLFLVAMFAVLGLLLYAALWESFSPVNYVIFCVTASAGLLLLWNFSSLVSPTLMLAVKRSVVWVLVFEVGYGLLQAWVRVVRTRSFDVGNGDLVRGTIDPSFQHTPSASNPIYAVLLSTLLLFIFGTTRGRLTPGTVAFYMLTLAAWLLASVMHTIIFFGVAVGLSLLVLLRPTRLLARFLRRRSRRGQTWLLCLALVLLGVGGQLLLPRNVGSIPAVLQQTVNFGPSASSEKARATYNTLVLLPEQAPLQPLLGLGPGQYSSRASLMNSGLYLRGGLPGFIPPYQHPLADRYILSLWVSFLQNRPNGGSSYFPYYSWLSLYGELGLLGLACVLGWVIHHLRRLRRWRSASFPNLPLAMIVLLCYVALLGFQDNYWEFTQAIMPASVLFKLSYDYLRVEHAHALYQRQTLGEAER